MANVTLRYTYTTGATLYAYPLSQSLADWSTYRVALTEAASPNAGRYTGTLDDNYPTWVVFSGATQPASWDVAVSEPIDLTVQIVEAATSVGVNVTVVSPVATTGQITSPIVIGDDYLAANGRAFVWTIPEVTGVTAATALCYFGGQFGSYSWLVDGVVSDNGDGTWDLTFDLAKTDTENLIAGYYQWSVEVQSAAGVEITRVRAGANRKVELVEKQT